MTRRRFERFENWCGRERRFVAPAHFQGPDIQFASVTRVFSPQVRARPLDLPRRQQLLAAVETLHARDSGTAYTLEQLREAPRAEQERYRRRRERAEQQERDRQRSEAEERLRVRARRKRRREARTREAKAVTGHGIGKRKSASEGRRKRREMGVRKRAKGLGADHGEGMTQLGVVASLAGAARRAVRVSSDTDPDSDGSDVEGRARPVVRGGGGLDARHGAAIEAMEREQRRRKEAERERRAVGRERREAERLLDAQRVQREVQPAGGVPAHELGGGVHGEPLEAHDDPQAEGERVVGALRLAGAMGAARRAARGQHEAAPVGEPTRRPEMPAASHRA